VRPALQSVRTGETPTEPLALFRQNATPPTRERPVRSAAGKDRRDAVLRPVALFRQEGARCLMAHGDWESVLSTRWRTSLGALDVVLHITR
jgi:hypothetical protein